jgi:DNA-binding PadR family transcriptional regulator
MSPTQIIILEIIKANDGKFSWYQLDRELTYRGGGLDPAIVSKNLMPALHELEQGGFITTAAAHSPGQPLYSITPKGLECLEVDREGTGIRDETGAEESAVRTGTGHDSSAVPTGNPAHSGDAIRRP